MTRIDDAVRYARRRARSIGQGRDIGLDPELETLYSAYYAAVNRSSTLTEEDVKLLEANGLSSEDAEKFREQIKYAPGWLVRQLQAGKEQGK